MCALRLLLLLVRAARAARKHYSHRVFENSMRSFCDRKRIIITHITYFAFILYLFIHYSFHLVACAKSNDERNSEKSKSRHGSAQYQPDSVRNVWLRRRAKKKKNRLHKICEYKINDTQK